MSLGENAASFLRRISGKPPKTAAVILAGGSGTRMGGGEKAKQWLPILGEPVIVHTIRAFEECDVIEELVLVSRREDMKELVSLVKAHRFRKVKRVVAGGENRQESARLGLEAIGDDMQYIAIHDACRCLITPDMIEKVVKEAHLLKAACAGTPVTDTIKHVGHAAFVKETPPREEYWAAQTPQVFRTSLYRCAAYSAKRYGWVGTDDASLVERAGQTVRMVDCGRENIKITYLCDLAVAEAILLERRAKKNETKEDER